jgi:hypothetical protein
VRKLATENRELSSGVAAKARFFVPDRVKGDIVHHRSQGHPTFVAVLLEFGF